MGVYFIINFNYRLHIKTNVEIPVVLFNKNMASKDIKTTRSSLKSSISFRDLKINHYYPLYLL